MEQLKKCPFCGGEVYLTQEDFYGRSDNDWMVSCDNCSLLFGFTSQFLTKEEAIKAWNTRKPMERIVERLEACHDTACEAKEQINDFYMERRICKEEYCKGRIHAYQRAIEIVKEEGAV